MTKTTLTRRQFVCIAGAAVIVRPERSPRAFIKGRTADELPSPSRVLNHFAWQLIGTMPEGVCRELFPRIAATLYGNSSSREKEWKRANYITLETIRQINAEVCSRVIQRGDLAEQCVAVRSVDDAWHLARSLCEEPRQLKTAWGAAGNALSMAGAALGYAENYATFAYASSADGFHSADDHVPFVCGHAVNVADCASRATDNPRAVYAKVVGILERTACV